ncbi:ABC transporter permease [Thermoflexus sp.]|uniref:ABC transporter permease n=1 Tax=Thermoflexus sp. TaxID=1969742 RepID=UPI0025F43F47|nr:ABC transporter permease subunit [Thermoflexus sp.]MDW8181493.1 ABC transporter permease subunit [Anaerolineae bacterium]MCS6963402.1 ABC transporter permease subunit [Thermoflexus sp.]MCS7352034.1 ABC transporter permease subunit [Thermoflexus sp.]MCX7691660.1 ABC transporter permease subunit [Thermoflexus sp.]MDW8183827.1 ABC transporter permease subunit [Anaerolineae bacterium]
MRKATLWNWFWILLGLLYFFLPLLATFHFSLRARKEALSLLAYQQMIEDTRIWQALLYSIQIGLLTIGLGLLLMVPTVYWVHLRARYLRPMIEFFSLLPFVIPAIVLVFGLIRIYSGDPFPLTNTYAGTDFLLIAGYVVLTLPYLYRAIDAGMTAIDVATLTEAAQSLGAGWGTILFRVIVPNLRSAMLGAAFLILAIVLGEFTIASFIVGLRAFGPVIWQVGQNRAYEASALVIFSFLLTWILMALINFVARRAVVTSGPR